LGASEPTTRNDSDKSRRVRGMTSTDCF
jgi:hypothetical protein